MRTPAWFRELDPDWQACWIGALGAPSLFVIGIVVGEIEGGLLPWDCEGMACLFFAVLVLYSGALLAIWLLLTAITALTRRWWPESEVRTRSLRILAGLSYVPTAWVIGSLLFDLA